MHHVGTATTFKKQHKRIFPTGKRTKKGEGCRGGWFAEGPGDFSLASDGKAQ